MTLFIMQLRLLRRHVRRILSKRHLLRLAGSRVLCQEIGPQSGWDHPGSNRISGSDTNNVACPIHLQLGPLQSLVTAMLQMRICTKNTAACLYLNTCTCFAAALTNHTCIEYSSVWRRDAAVCVTDYTAVIYNDALLLNRISTTVYLRNHGSCVDAAADVAR